MRTLLTAAAALALMGSMASAGSVNLISDTTAGNLGAFTGTMSYDDDSTLTITLKNTTLAGGGYITGFLFNIDGSATAQLTPSPTANFLDLVTRSRKLAVGLGVSCAVAVPSTLNRNPVM